MKKLLLLLSLFFSVSAFSQAFQDGLITVDSSAALRTRMGVHKGLALVKAPDFSRNGEFLLFEYDSTVTASDNGTTILRVTVVPKGAWKQVVTEIVRASAFGIETKDSDNEAQAGLVNMAGKLTALMDYLRFTNAGRIRMVYLPPGYIFTGYFEVPSNVILMGTGGTTEQSGRSGTTLVQYPGLNQDIMGLKGIVGSTIRFWQGDIVNIKFKGSPTATAGRGITTIDTAGVISTPSDLSRVSGCIFRDIYGDNLYLANGAAPMLIEWCKFLNGKTRGLVAERPTIGESGLQNLEIVSCSFDAILDIPLLIKNFGSKSQVNIRGYKNEARRNSAAGNQVGSLIGMRFEESAVKAKIDGAYHTSSINDGGDTTRYPGPLIEIVSTAGRTPTLNIQNAVIRLPEGPNSGDTPVLIKGTHIDYDVTDVKYGGKYSQHSDTINGSPSMIAVGSEGFRIPQPLLGRYPIGMFSGAWPGFACYQPTYLNGIANKKLSYFRLRNGNITWSNYADDGTEYAFYNQSFGSAGNGQRATWQIVENRQIANMPKQQFFNNGGTVPVNAGGWEWRARSSSTNILGHGTISDDGATYYPGFDIVRSMNFTRPGGMYMYMPFIFGGPTARTAGTSVFATLANVNDSVGNGKDENSWTVVNATAKDLVRLDSVQVNQLIILHFADGNTTMRNKRPAIATQNQFLLQGGYDWNPTANSMWAGMKVGSYIIELGRSYGTYTGSLPWIQNQYSTFQAASARLDSLQSKYFKPADSVFLRQTTQRGVEWGTDALVTGNNIPLSSTARSNSRLFINFAHTTGSSIGSAPIISTRDTLGITNFQVDGRSLYYRGVKISDGTIFYDAHPSTTANAYAVVVYDSVCMCYRTIPASSLPGGGGGGSGTVNSGTANRLAYYSSTGTAVSQLAAITANRALISDANGLPVHSAVTATELGYSSGVTSAIQTQINARQTAAQVQAIIDAQPGYLNYIRNAGTVGAGLVVQANDSIVAIKRVDTAYGTTKTVLDSLVKIGADTASASGLVSKDRLANALSGLGGTMQDLTVDASLAFVSGTAYNGSTARQFGLNLANPNTWSATQTFASINTTNSNFYIPNQTGGGRILTTPFLTPDASAVSFRQLHVGISTTYTVQANDAYAAVIYGINNPRTATTGTQPYGANVLIMGPSLGVQSGRTWTEGYGLRVQPSTGAVDNFAARFDGKLKFDATITAGGTTGAQTINKPAGSVNIAAAGTSVTVTNSLVTASSIVVAVVATNDGTAYIKNVVCSAGSFVITLGAAATAETKVNFIVTN